MAANTSRPGAYQRGEPLGVSGEQRPAGFLETRRVAGHCGHEPVSGLLRLPDLVPACQVLPALEMRAPHYLGYSRRREVLPFLAAMLEHPDRDQRTSVVMRICTLPDARRDAEMALHCPDRSPLRDPSQEPALIEFWKTRWAGQPDSNNAVRSPDRYRRAAAPPPDRVISMEQRFNRMAMMYAGAEKKRSQDPSQPA